jgi:hypothetical protein
VAAQALGMAKVVSEDALRRALERIDEAASAAWMRPSLMHSVRGALDRPWVLDIDASIKPLYGRQEGAEIGYGNEGILVTLEQRQQPYLLRLRQTKNVQRLVAQQFARQDWSRPDSQGCQMVEAQLQLHGWSTKRRVVIVRQRIRGGIARERRVDGKQLRLDLAGPSVHEGDKLWEYAVLVTDVAYPLESIGQLYRDRADAENAFDELKNQWGLGGFTTQDINRCQTVARACALVYNWWSWYCRAAHPTGRLEAITSRPLLLAAVARCT